MLRVSFRLLVNRSFPRPWEGKQIAGAAAIVALAAGCGGSEREYRQVLGRGYSFQAPVGWSRVRTPRALGMQHGSVDLVQVTRLPLERTYEPSLFPRVVPELDRVARRLAVGSGATVRGSTVRALGQPARQYELSFSRRVEVITFVLRGRTSYQLLCRRDEHGDDAPCRRLVSSFRAG